MTAGRFPRYPGSMNRLQELLSTPAVDIATVARYLDEADPDRRLGEARSLGRAQQRHLFDAAAGFRPIGLEDLVPSAVPDDTEVVHEGRNTIPVFTRFAKVFFRPPEHEAPGELWGYNRQEETPFLETVVGPGYYVAYPHHVEGEVLVDYLRVPPRGLPHWPPVLPNSARLSRFVYHGTQDVLRGVSEHVSIGRAQKRGKWLPAWFVLVRVDGPMAR